MALSHRSLALSSQKGGSQPPYWLLPEPGIFMFSRFLAESYNNLIVYTSYNTSCFHILTLSGQFPVFSRLFRTFSQKKIQHVPDPAEKICWHESLSSPLLSANCTRICENTACYDLGFLEMWVIMSKMDTAATVANIS